MKLEDLISYSIFSSIHRTFARTIHDHCLYSVYDCAPNCMRDVREHIHNAFNDINGFNLRHHSYRAAYNIIKSYDT
jgi:hypothetical protein